MQRLDRSSAYSTIIVESIQRVFEEDPDLLETLATDNDAAKDFIYAISCVAPTYVFNWLTKQEKNQLEVNHIANQLVFEFCKSVDDEHK